MDLRGETAERVFRAVTPKAVALDVPGVDREMVREYYRQHGLLELYDAIEKAG